MNPDLPAAEARLNEGIKSGTVCMCIAVFRGKGRLGFINFSGGRHLGLLGSRNERKRMETGRWANGQDDLDIGSLETKPIIKESAPSNPSHHRRITNDERIILGRWDDSPSATRESLVEIVKGALHCINVRDLDVLLRLDRFNHCDDLSSYVVRSDDRLVWRHATLKQLDCPLPS